MTLPAKKSLKSAARRKDEAKQSRPSPPRRKMEGESAALQLQKGLGNRGVEALLKGRRNRAEEAAAKPEGKSEGERPSAKAEKEAPPAAGKVAIELPAPKGEASKEKGGKIEAVKLEGPSEKMVERFADAPASRIAATFPLLGGTLGRRLEKERAEEAQNAPKLVAVLAGEKGKKGPRRVAVRTAEKEAQMPSAPPSKAGEEPELPEHRDFAKPPQNSKILAPVSGRDPKIFVEWFKNHFGSFLSSIRTTDSGLNTDAGETPKVRLEGATDPARAQETKEAARQKVEAEKRERIETFANHPGQEQIRPREVEAPFEVTIETKGGEPPKTDETEGMKNYLEVDIPKEVREKADGMMRPILEKGLGRLKSEAKKAAESRNRQKEQEVAAKRKEAAKLNKEAQLEQEDAVSRGRKSVADEQQRGIDEAHGAAGRFGKEVSEEQGKTRKSLLQKASNAAKEAAKELDKGEQKARRLKEDGEKEARAKKAELEAKSRKKSWWERAADAIKSAVRAITSAIDAIFTRIRKAVKRAIEAAKKAAIGLINKARKWILDKLERFRKWAKSMVDRYLKRFFPKLAERINKAIDRFVDRAKKVVNRVADRLIAGIKALADALSRALDKILSVFQTALKAAVQVAGAILTGDFAEALRVAIQAACDIAGIDSGPIFGFIRRAGALFAKILKGPKRFFRNLFKAIGGGVRRFVKNIKKHLITGLFGWLTGVLSEGGIELPKSFDAKGIFSLAMQILGLTYANVKARILRRYPKAAGVIDKIEKGFEIVRELVTKGPSALWERVKASLAGFRQTIISAIRNYVITTLVKEGFLWLLSLLNPVSALVKLLKLIYDFIMFLVESFDQIKAFVLSVYRSVAAIAAGKLEPAKKAVESSLARILPVAINLLARLAGLGGIAKTVRKIIAKVSHPVNRVIDKIVDKAVAFAKKLLTKVRRGGKRALRKVRRALRIDRRLGRPIAFRAGKTAHRLWIEKRKGRPVVMVASRPGPLEGMIGRWESKLSTLDPKKRKRARTLLAQVKRDLLGVTVRAQTEDRLQEWALADRKVDEAEAAKVKAAERQTTSAERNTARDLAELMLLVGEGGDLIETFKDRIAKLHPHFAPFVLEALRNGSKKLRKKRNWDGILHRLLASDSVKNVYDRPLAGSGALGRSLQREVAMAAMRAAVKKEKEAWKRYLQKRGNVTYETFIARRIVTIHRRQNEHAEAALEALQRYLLDRTKREEAIGKLQAFYEKSIARKSKAEHREYKPHIRQIEIKENTFRIEYTYSSDAEKQKRFEVRFNFANLNREDEVKQTVKGENLSLKLRGSRGWTTSSGHLAKFKTDGKEVDPRTILIHYLENRGVREGKRGKKIETMSYEELLGLLSEKERRLFRRVEEENSYLQKEQKFDSAHLVADWFGGSGYRRALNLVVTSAQYNRVVMKGAEEKIVEDVKKKSRMKEKESGPSLFDLSVTATWDILSDSEVKRTINRSSIFNALSPNLKKETDDGKKLADAAAKELFDVLASKQDPRRVLSVRYYEGRLKSPVHAELSKQEIGCDIWMSAFFKFERKRKCAL
ncbi:hypothetical protein [Hydrogenimonas sp.]